MNATLRRYRQAIQSGRADPVRRWDGRASVRLLDSHDAGVPLLVLNLDVFVLRNRAVEVETGPSEWVLVPVEGRWEVEVAAGGQGWSFRGERSGGPFAAWPGGCNGQAVYVPRNATFRLRGQGEAIGFSGPAFADKPPGQAAAGPDHMLVSRGTAVWRRDVVTLAGIGDLTTNLIVGETYSPPGLWSGTPIHVHDQPGDDQSDHEEIYYHLAPRTAGRWGPFGVQLLFDDQGLDRAYMLHHRTAVAIPGGAHPVAAGPNGPMMYIWCLGSERAQPLAMRDVPEFAWLKQVGAVIDRFVGRRGPARLARSEVLALADEAGLTAEQVRILQFHLEQLGFTLAE